MKQLLIPLILLAPLSVAAKVIEKCGIYETDGYYTNIGESKAVLLDRGSNSEIRFHVKDANSARLISNTQIGVNFRLKLKFVSSCNYDCQGEIKEVIRALDPFEEPRSFLSTRPAPIPGTEIKCL